MAKCKIELAPVNKIVDKVVGTCMLIYMQVSVVYHVTIVRQHFQTTSSEAMRPILFVFHK